MLRESSAMTLSPVAAMRQNAAKSGNLSGIRLLAPLLRPYRGAFALGLIAVLAAGGVVLGLGQVFRHLVDQGLAVRDSSALLETLMVMMGLVALLALASYGRLVLVAGVTEHVMADLRTHIMKHVLALDLPWFETQKTGDLLSRLSGDIGILQVVLGTSVPIALRNALLVTGGLVMMALSSLTLSGLVLALVPVIVGVLMLLGPSVRRFGRTLQDTSGLSGALASETLQAMREIQAFSREAAQSALYAQANARVVTAAWAYIRRRALLSSLIILVVFSSITGLLWFGGQQVLQGHLSAGELSAFVFYALLVAGSVGALSEIYGDMQRASGALERLQEILAVQPTILAPAAPAPLPRSLQGIIHFEAVDFSYPSRSDTQTLNAVTLTFDPGQTIAIVGPSGAGKTTLFALLLRFYDPQRGRITLDGMDIRIFDPAVYRRLFGMVPQDPTLLSLSLRENIAFGAPNADQDTIIRAAQQAGAHIFIEHFPDGYDTLLGERGTRLSGGQAQRIALARALLRDPMILLLDEATAHLDSETERAIQSALTTTRRNKTTIIIAHRLSTVQHADRIIVMDQGRIVAQGTHEDLLKTNVLYHKLATAQLQQE